MNNYDIIVLWINQITQALPLRVIATYVELLIGALIAKSGHLTDALLAVGHQKHFSTYYWLIEKAKWSWLKLTYQMVQLIVTCFPRKQWHFIVDDFICPRASRQAPHVAFHHDHGQKPNRPTYIWGQQWVALGLSLTWGKMTAALPLLLKLHKSQGNRTKLTTAVNLIKVLLPKFRKTGDEIIRCLVDAWYMKANFVLPLLQKGVHIIGQVRKDTALFNAPEPHTGVRKRGRPRKYGQRISDSQLAALPVKQLTMRVFGEIHQVTFRWQRCLVRFLKGQPVIAVWCKLDDQTHWSLIICTDLTLTPERIIRLYARRWKIEPMFNEVKHHYGVSQAWQQKNQALHRWVSMLGVAYSLTRMASLIAAGSKTRQQALTIIPWRKRQPITAGMIQIGLQLFFRQFTFRQLWCKKSKKLML
jgi:hypothetical protein